MGFVRRLQNHPKLLATSYKANLWIAMKLKFAIRIFGADRLARWLRAPEEFVKRQIFDCKMCGQCILHSTGMTCPMTCPKNLRNGPCGGVRANGHCEVEPEMRCIWVEAFERSQMMTTYKDELHILQPPVDRQLEGSSAWVNLMTGKDRVTPAGWGDTPRAGG
ncbi:MAG: methylenetetrahydrofolate reductase C-terminal domain-containing protein [Myxococcales bacterium]|nr:methylenetetrahydrofolate reductase C-terminal domain-containing protein [Myxococcales bacterium]